MAIRAKTDLFLARKRADSLTPILVAIDSSLVRSTGPGMPISSGMTAPRDLTRLTHVLTTAGSKHRLLTRLVACSRLSHIACTVMSSLIVGCDSG